jgi:hypothetical protein
MLLYLTEVFRARGLLIALMMEAVTSCETWVSIYQTIRRNILEDSHLYICHSRKRFLTK